MTTEFGKPLDASPRPPIPGLVVFDLPGARRHPRLVQGELAAREDGRARAARLRAGAEQRLVQRRRRHDPRHPRRAVGQVGLGRDRPDLRRLGRPARGPDVRRGLHDRARPVAGDLRAPRRRQLATRRSSRTPRTPTSSTTTGRPTRRTRSSTSPTRPPRSPGRSRSAEVEISAKDLAHPRLADVTPIAPRKILVARRRRAARSRAARRVRATPHVEYATRDELDLTVADLGAARRWRDYDTIINAAAYTAVDAAETPEGRRDAWAANVTAVAALARDRRPRTASPSSTSPATTSSTAPQTAPTPRTTPSARSASTARPRPPATPSCATVPRHYIVRTSLGHRRGQQLRAHDGIARRARRSTRTSSTTRSAGSPSPPTSPRGIRHLLERTRRLRHLQPHRRRRAHHRGPTSPDDVFELTGHDPAPRHRRLHRPTTSPHAAGTHRPAAPQQHPQHHQDHRRGFCMQ